MKIGLDSGFLAYDSNGSGIPLLFIHGYPLSRKIWEPQVEDLHRQANIVSLDLRGHGESSPFDPPYSMDLLAEDCKLVLDQLGINEPVIICGHSMGGYITLAMYRKYPDLFKAMILTSTRAGADSAEGKANRDASIKTATQSGASAVSETVLPKMLSQNTFQTNPELVENIKKIMVNTSVNGIIGALQAMRDRQDSTPYLSQIKCPVLIVHGTDDQQIPIKEAEAMEQAIPNSQLARIAEAGHLPSLEQPENYNLAVREFILSLR